MPIDIYDVVKGILAENSFIIYPVYGILIVLGVAFFIAVMRFLFGLLKKMFKKGSMFGMSVKERQFTRKLSDLRRSAVLTKNKERKKIYIKELLKVEKELADYKKNICVFTRRPGRKKKVYKKRRRFFYVNGKDMSVRKRWERLRNR